MPLEPSADTSGSPERSTILHATCVRWGEHGLLIRGASGVGKSDLALRLIGRGAVLIADDVVRIRRIGNHLVVGAVGLPGAIELRGHGIYQLTSAAETVLSAQIQLETNSLEERLQAPECIDLLGIDVPLIRLDPNSGSAVATVRVLLTSPRLA